MVAVRKPISCVVVLLLSLLRLCGIKITKRCCKKDNFQPSTDPYCSFFFVVKMHKVMLTLTLPSRDCQKIRFCFPAIHSHLISLVQVVIQYTLELVVGFLIPYGIIVFSYICILRKIRQTKFRRRIRSEKLILAIVVTFCIFWLPYHVINMVQVCHTSCILETTHKCFKYTDFKNIHHACKFKV